MTLLEGLASLVQLTKCNWNLGEWLKLKDVWEPPPWCPLMLCVQKWNVFPGRLLVINLFLYSTTIY